MDKLIEFLKARLDEREAMLHAVGMARLGWATFLRDDGSMGYTSAVSQNGDIWACDGHVVEPASVQVVFDPKLELADVAAKRQILQYWEDGDGGFVGQILHNCLDTPLRLLALPYVEHPAFREEWRA